MLKLVSEEGRFALKDNSMIFSNVVYLTDRNDARMYHLIGKNGDEITPYVDKFMVEE